MSESKLKSTVSGIAEQLPMDRLKGEAQNYGQALAQRGVTKLGEHVEGLTGKLNDFAEGGGKAGMARHVMEGDSPVKAGLKSAGTKLKDAVKGKLGGGGGKGNKLKVTNIYETIDVGVPREVAYKQWTEFEDFPKFTKKVENVSQEAPEKVKWQAQIFWSHRSWNAKIVDQVPNERIVWKSEGQKGHVDGSITFHALTPDLTRIIMVLEYYPKGLFEHTGNLWRAQGRRARLELKHFARHVNTQTILHQDEQQGWTGEIHSGHVEKQPGEADDSEQQDQDQAQDQQGQDQQGQDQQGQDQQGQDQQGQDQQGQGGDQDQDEAQEQDSDEGRMQADEPESSDEGRSDEGEQAQQKQGQQKSSQPQQKSGQAQKSGQGQQNQQKSGQGQQSQQQSGQGQQSQQKTGQGQSQQKPSQGQQKGQGQQGGGQGQQNQQSGSGNEGQ